MDKNYFKIQELKNPESAVINEISKRFNLTPILAQAYFKEIKGLFEEHFKAPKEEGVIIFEAIRMEDPPGKQLSECRRIPVRLTLDMGGDLDIYRQRGLKAMRQARILRLASVAYEQGALLTQEDLSRLLSSSVNTIKRDLAALREDFAPVPTRGNVKDIGPSVSHKTRIVQLYLTNMDFQYVIIRSRHSQKAIERYLKTFTQVARLWLAGHSEEEISLITGISAYLCKEYLDLVKQYHETERFKSLFDDFPGKKNSSSGKNR